MINAAQPFLEELLSQENEEFLKVVGNVLFDKSGPRHLRKTLSIHESAFSRLWQGFVEIRESFEAVQDVAIYIKHFPPKSTQISKARFLRYHIGNYLNEVYTLTQRLEAYFRVVFRVYKKDPRLRATEARSAIINRLLTTFNKINAIRNKHVHQVRYDDEDLGRLSLLELLSEITGSMLSSALNPQAVRQTRKKWVNTIIQNNHEIQETLGVYFSILHPVVFDEEEKWIAPTIHDG